MTSLKGRPECRICWAKASVMGHSVPRASPVVLAASWDGVGDCDELSDVFWFCCCSSVEAMLLLLLLRISGLSGRTRYCLMPTICKGGGEKVVVVHRSIWGHSLSNFNKVQELNMNKKRNSICQIRKRQGNRSVGTSLGAALDRKSPKKARGEDTGYYNDNISQWMDEQEWVCSSKEKESKYLSWICQRLHLLVINVFLF